MPTLVRQKICQTIFEESAERFDQVVMARNSNERERSSHSLIIKKPSKVENPNCQEAQLWTKVQKLPCCLLRKLTKDSPFPAETYLCGEKSRGIKIGNWWASHCVKEMLLFLRAL